MAAWYRQGKLVSYFLNNAAKTCLYGLKISENTEIGHFFQSRAFFHPRCVYSAGKNFTGKTNPDVILPVKIKLYRQNKSRSYSVGKT